MKYLCVNPSCDRLVDEYLRDGECHACYEYRRRFGRERPYRDDGRSERVGKTKVLRPEDFEDFSSGVQRGRVMGMGTV